MNFHHVLPVGSKATIDTFDTFWVALGSLATLAAVIYAPYKTLFLRDI